MGDRLMEAGKGNVRGHFENLDFVEFQERMLRSLGYDEAGLLLAGPTPPAVDSFDEAAYAEARRIVAENARETPWGWKDPRCTLMLDFWARVTPGAFYVLLYREPAEVIDSLFHRGDSAVSTTPEGAARVWLAYNEILLRFARLNRTRCILANAAVVGRNPESFLSFVATRFSLKVDASVPSTFDPELMHQIAPDSAEPILLRYLVPETERLFVDLEGEADLAAGVYRDSPVSPQRARAVFFEDWASTRRSMRIAGSADAVRQVADLEDSAREREGELLQTQRLLSAADAEMRRAQEAFKTQRGQLDATIEQLASLRESAHATEIELVRAQEQLNAVRAERDGAVMRLEERRASLSHAEGLAAQSAERFHQTELELVRTQAQLRFAEHEREAFAQRAQALGRDLEQVQLLRAELDAKSQLAQTLEARAVEFAQRADDVALALRTAEDRLRALQAELGAERGRATALEAANTEINEQVESAWAETREVRTELLEWLDQLEAVTKALASEQEHVATVQAEAEAERRELSSEIGALLARTEVLAQTLEEARAEHASQVDALGARAEMLTEVLEKLRNEYAVEAGALREREAALTRALEEAIAEGETLRSELQTERARYEEQSEAVINARQHESVLAEELRESLDRLSATRVDLEALRAEHKVTAKTLEETSSRFLEHVNVSLSRTREEAQQIAGMIDEIQASRFWAVKRSIARLFGRGDTHR